MLRLEDIFLLSYKDILVPEKGDSQIYDPTRRETYRKAKICLLGKIFINPIGIYYSRHKGYKNEQMCAVGFWKEIKIHRHENRIQNRNKHFMYLR